MKTPLSVCRLLRLFALLLGLFSAAPPSHAQNPIQTENGKAGTTAWQLANPATNREIEGYASLTSVNRGSAISLYVNCATSYTINIYRLGWYGGAGGRLVAGPISRTATPQSMPTADATGMIECRWTNPYTFTVPSTSDPTNWCSGAYVAKLTTSGGKDSYIVFTVRDDLRPSDLLFQNSVTTWQAYNNWGGRSLYSWNSDNSNPARKVSFNRPYALSGNPACAFGMGAGELLANSHPAWVAPTPGSWELNMIRFLERNGYDVTYCTNLDAHENGSLLLSHHAFLSVGHDEYWSNQARTAVTAARDAGVCLGFFSSNVCYWQVRFEASPANGAADRTMVGYKSYALTEDPYALDSDSSNDYLITTRFRDNPINRPEEQFIGVQYDFDPVDADMVIEDASSWICAGTGLSSGDVLPGMVGYEVDSMHGLGPANVNRIAHSPYSAAGNLQYSDMAWYQAGSGALVVATGSMQWSWGLDDWGAPALHPSRLLPAVQTMTRNILARFLAQSTSLTATGGLGEVSLAWTVRSGATGYNVKRSTTKGGPYTLIASNVAGDTYADYTVVNGTTYYYVVAPIVGGAESSPTIEVSATPTSAIRINCGGPAYTGSAGIWQADSYYNGGGAYAFLSGAITNTNDPALYYTVRSSTGSFGYTLPAAPGTYTLNLYFADDAGGAGNRFFNVYVAGNLALPSFDIVGAAGGPYTAVCKSFTVASDGSGIPVSFEPVALYPVICAIELVPASGSVPPAPAGLTAGPGQSAVQLAWDASATATSYKVKRSTTAGGPYTVIASGLTSTSYTDAGLSNGTTYYYVVSAANGAGEGPNSNEVSATPGVPLRINCGGPAYVGSTGLWQADAYFNGGGGYSFLSGAVANTSDPTLYYTCRSATGSFSYNLPAPPGTYTLNLYFADNSGGAGQRYFNVYVAGSKVLSSFDIAGAAGGVNTAVCKSFAVTSDGSGVAVSFEAVALYPVVCAIELIPSAAPTAPPAPSGLTATPGVLQIGLAWSASSGATGYNVKRSTTKGGAYSTVASGVASTSWTDKSTLVGITYYYVVSATNGAGESGDSNEASAVCTSPNVPAAPTNLVATVVSTSQINLKWTNNTGIAIGYKVERSKDNKSWTEIATLDRSATTYSATGLTTRTTYYFRVRCWNDKGYSAYSNTATAKTK